jgi:hypothetical protein
LLAAENAVSGGAQEHKTFKLEATKEFARRAAFQYFG